MSTNSTTVIKLEQGDSQFSIPLNFGVLPQVSVRADSDASGTIIVGGTMVSNVDIDYSQAQSFANPFFNPTMILLSDTTAEPVIGGQIDIAPDTYVSYKLDVDVLTEVGFNCTSIVGNVEIIITVEDSQYA